MAKLLMRVNQNGLEPFEVTETAAKVSQLLGLADEEGGLACFHNDGGVIYVNPDAVAYVLAIQGEVEDVITPNATK